MTSIPSDIPSDISANDLFVQYGLLRMPLPGDVVTNHLDQFYLAYTLWPIDPSLNILHAVLAWLADPHHWVVLPAEFWINFV